MQNSSPETADFDACRDLMRGGSRSFFAAGMLLPKRIYQPATALYAFCRLADDAIDDAPGKTAALLRLRARLDDAYAGRPQNYAADRAFAAVIEKHDIPFALPHALLEGFEWDAQNRRYEDFFALQDYAARVAGTVGAMMAVLMGARAPVAIARACDLGIAMQLTNIARDIGEDARAGRLYLPLAWLRAEGIDPDLWLQNPVFSPAIGRITQRLLEAADSLYARAIPGIAHLPMACRPGIRAAGLIYAEIGRALAQNGYDSITWRAHVPASRKLALLAQSVTAMIPKNLSAASAPALAAAHYLVDAASAPAPRYAQAPRLGLIETRVHWVFDLFERLQQQELGTP
jgi:phytoene synthase